LFDNALKTAGLNFNSQREDGFKQGSIPWANLYVVTGEYEVIAVAEAPNDEVVVANNSALSSLENVRTTTLRAFTPEEFAELVKQLP